MARLWDLVVVQWCVVLALLVGLPWSMSGYLLTGRMVWVPRPEVRRADLWGAGETQLRALPSDALAALAGTAIDPMVVQRVVLWAALALAGLGAARLVRDLGVGPMLATATLAVWNPYVAELLVTGRWPELVAYAGLPWIVVAVRHPTGVRWAVLTLALAAAALTPATGIVGLLLAVAAGAGRAGVFRPLVLATVLNAPWVVVAVLADRYPRTPDLDIGTEAPGPVTALLVVVGVVGLVGAVRLVRTDLPLVRALGGAAVVGALIASVDALAAGAVSDAVDVFGPAVLLQDAGMFLVLAVPFCLVAFGHGVGWLTRLVEERVVDHRWAVAPAVIAVALPLAALPALFDGVDDRVEPVEYPADWTAARVAVAASPVDGDILVLPFSALREHEWNAGRTVVDPAGLFFDRVTLTPTTGVPAADAVRALLEAGAPAAEFAAAGIGIVVLDPAAAPAVGGPEPVLLTGAREVPTGEVGLRVFELDGATPADRTEDREVLWAAWGLAGAFVLVALLRVVGASFSRLRSARV
ncbi:hypothetical protein HMPREF0063_10937 [Aeromicrobium marinum DSM 15272]|uniref:Tat pathway signal sequence domain protein n=1 Tax=Aeromicrobium marinum DSM 15272 TaxID=585531 RepID=E2SAE7_9ACTN|nr:hypothetical protein [Aeromicrobium marinum]EFQ84221.1 hypothetical protein HMPREF0063_10937 [Aeromicrobium marinum DSM 15272]